MKVFEFERKVNYYETDQMGIVHHSNYIRWLEEARLAFMDSIGLYYSEMEKHGILIPVLSVSCDYKTPARFGDTVIIKLSIKEFRGVKLIMEYAIFNSSSNNLIATAETKHCFTDSNLKPIILKKSNLDIYNIFIECMQ